MARPTKQEQLELELLENIAALISSALMAVGILAVRIQQIYRRVPHLLELLSGTQQEFTELVNTLDKIQVTLNELLTLKQTLRIENNKGEKE